MSLQSVSLLTGTGLVWTGAALTVAGLIVGAFLARKVWLTVVLVLLAALAVSSAAYDEVQLSHKRHQLEQLGN
jgi:beta-lactamase regulating signal transducer with metallopeptidase domain